MQFQHHIISLPTRYPYEFKTFGNADETPLYFDMLRNYTVNLKGKKERKFLTTRFKNNVYMFMYEFKV